VKRAILSDIHGNIEALHAVIADIRQNGIEEIYCLGDIVGYGPNPCECVDLAMTFDRCVLGNHEQGALYDPEGFSSGAERAIQWTSAQLQDESDEQNRQRWEFLCELPRNIRENGHTYVHGSPRSPLHEYIFPEDVYNTRKLEKVFGLIQGTCFIGHTHVPGIFTDDGKYLSPSEFDMKIELDDKKTLVNVGSVGQPRDNDKRSCYVILSDKTLEFRRVDYPFDETIEKIYAIPQLDNFLGDRLREGR
jgi:diadenosine tetraphosphatase ApaH/serine/threonine PP2A family protein phosphatase